MRNFIRLILIVSLPTVLFLGLMIFNGIHQNVFLYYFSKTLPKQFILGDPYDDSLIRDYKINRISLAEYKTICIGSSRVLEFSEDMFKEPFFNLGYTVLNTDDFLYLIKKLNLKNKKLILGIDQWLFNEEWSKQLNAQNKKFNIVGNLFNYNKIVDIPYVNYNSTTINGIMLIGQNATEHLSGILSDGSFYYGSIYEKRSYNNKLDSFAFIEAETRINDGIYNFKYGKKPDAHALFNLKLIIDLCKNNNNEIVLFFPPYSPSIWGKMMKSGHYNYILEASNQIKELCSKDDVPFFDFSNFASIDNQYIDGFHGGKQIYYQILQTMGFNIEPLTFLSPFEATTDQDLFLLRTEFFKSKK